MFVASTAAINWISLSCSLQKISKHCFATVCNSPTVTWCTTTMCNVRIRYSSLLQIVCINIWTSACKRTGRPAPMSSTIVSVTMIRNSAGHFYTSVIKWYSFTSFSGALNENATWSIESVQRSCLIITHFDRANEESLIT